MLGFKQFKKNEELSIFRQLHIKKYSIIFLQETYSSTDQEKIWSNEWGSKVYFSHGSKQSKGVAILFDSRLKVLVGNQICCENGRILILQFCIDDQKFVCANIYAPNNGNAQVIFFKQLKSLLQQFPSDSIIVGGDFNCPLSKTDKEGGRDISSRKNVASEIEQLMCILDLNDVWRTLHPGEKQFTWRTSDLKIKCRLDYWLIARRLLQKCPVQKCEIKHAGHCDHSLVTVVLQINMEYPRGPGFWKFNSFLLEDDVHTEKSMFKIPHFINEYQDLEDNGLLWELIKMEIRAFPISYSKQKAKMKKDYEEDQNWRIWLKTSHHLKLSRNTLKLRTNWKRFPTIEQGAHECVPKPVGTSLANEVRNISLILRDEIKTTNALSAL